MSGNLEPDRNSGNNISGGGAPSSGPLSSANKIYPMDLAMTPQKITIVKSGAASGDSKLHLVNPQGKPHLLSHAGPISLVRPSPQIISQGVATQPPQMIVSGTQLISGTQIVNQNSQIISPSQIIGPSSQLLTPQTIISQSTQLINQGAQIVSQGSQLLNQAGPGASQVLSVGSPLVGAGGVVVTAGTTLRSLPSSMRILPPSTLTSPRTASSVTVTPLGAALNSKPGVVGISSHVPRGPAAGASLAVPRATARPVTPVPSAIPVSALGGWSARPSLRGPALVYPARASPRHSVPRPASSAPGAPTTSQSIHSQTPPPISAVTAASLVSTGVATPAPRMSIPRPVAAPRVSAPLVSGVPLTPLAPAQRAPLPLTQPLRVSAPPSGRPSAVPVLQRNFQQTKIVNVGAPVSSALQRSALYYEVTKTTAPPTPLQTPFTYSHAHTNFVQHNLPVSMTMVSVPSCVESRQPVVTCSTPGPPIVASAGRPSILRRRDNDGSPSKSVGTSTPYPCTEMGSVGWAVRRADTTTEGPEEEEGAGGEGGSTTVSAASSPGPDDEPLSPPRPATPPVDISPRKKPRKQLLTSEVRQCELQNDEVPPASPAALPTPPPRRSLLGSGWVCGYRATALHFTRPTEVRRREYKPPLVSELANQKNVLTKANGWKVHHLTAQMDDIVELETASCEQLDSILRTLDSSKAPHLHSIMELVKGNMQRSKIVCEDVREARADILRVFTHRTLVADILARHDTRCLRKQRIPHN